MKILQVTQDYPPYNTGGSVVYTENLCQELAKKHQVFVFHRINDLHLKEYTLTHKSSDNLEIFNINNTFRSYDSFKMTYKNNVIAEKFGLVLDQVTPDIVHIQHLLYLSTKIIEEIQKRRIPIVFTLHDYWLICPQGQLFKDNAGVCNQDNNLECINCILHHLAIKKYIFDVYYFLNKVAPKNLLPLLRNIYLNYCRFSFLSKSKAAKLIEERTSHMKAICSKVDLFISPSRFLRSKFIDFGIPEEKIIFLPHGIDLNKLKNLRKVTSDKLRLGFIANLLPAKGAHVLIQCFNNIENENIELKIYGRVLSYKGILGNYLNYIKKIAKNKNIKLMGGFNNKNISEIFSEIDILVVPSIWYEASSIVTMEAFASQVPVIASDIGGIPELIKDGVDGLLFNPGNVGALRKKLEYAINNREIITKFKENIPKIKSIEENAREIEEIYSRLIG